MTFRARPMTPLRRIRRFVTPLAAVALFTACPLAQPAMAQTTNQAPATKLPNDKMTPIETPPQPDAIELGTGP